MKFIFSSIIVFLVVAGAFAQKLPSISSNLRDSVYQAYQNIDFAIGLKMHEAETDQVELKYNQPNLGQLSKLSDTLYTIRFYNAVEETKIKLYYKGLPVDVITIKSGPIPLPNISFGTEDHIIRKSFLKTLKKLDIHWQFTATEFELYTFRLMIIEEGREPFFYNIRGGDLPQHVGEALAKANPAKAKIIIDELKIKTKSNYILNLDGTIQYQIVE